MKAQASFELMILIAFLIAISLGFILLFQSQFVTTGTFSRIKIEDICTNVAEKINNAFEYGFGYEQNITLPIALDNQSYTITVTNQTVVCEFGESTSIENLLTNNVRNATSSQPFQISPRTIKVANVNGIIVIS